MSDVPGILDGIPDEDVYKTCECLVVELQERINELNTATQQHFAGTSVSLAVFKLSLSNKSLSPAKTRTQCLAFVRQWSKDWVGAFLAAMERIEADPKRIDLIKQLCSDLISTLKSQGIPTQARLLLSSTVLKTLSSKCVPTTSTDLQTIAARAWELYASTNAAGQAILEVLCKICYEDKQLHRQLDEAPVPVKHDRVVLDILPLDRTLLSRFISDVSRPGVRYSANWRTAGECDVWVDPFLQDKVAGKPFFLVFPELVPVALKHNISLILEHISDKTLPTSARGAFNAVSGLGGTCLADTVEYMSSLAVRVHGMSPYVCVADESRSSLLHLVKELGLPILPAAQHCDLDAEVEEAVSYDIFSSLLGKCVQQNNLGMLRILTQACLDKKDTSAYYLAQLMTVFQLRHGGHGAGSSPHSLLSYAVWKGYDDVAKLLSAFMCDVFTRKMTSLKLPEHYGTVATAVRRAALIDSVASQCRKAIPHSHVVFVPQVHETLLGILGSLSNLLEHQKIDTSIMRFSHKKGNEKVDERDLAWILDNVVPQLEAVRSIAQDWNLFGCEFFSDLDRLLDGQRNPPPDLTLDVFHIETQKSLTRLSQAISDSLPLYLYTSTVPAYYLVQHISEHKRQATRPKDTFNVWAKTLLGIDPKQANAFVLHVYTGLRSLWSRIRYHDQWNVSSISHRFDILVHELLVTACEARMHMSSTTGIEPWREHINHMMADTKKSEFMPVLMYRHIYDANTGRMYGNQWNKKYLEKMSRKLFERSTKDILKPFVTGNSACGDTLHLLQLGTGGGKSKVIREMVEFLVKALPPAATSTAGTDAAPAWPADVQVQVDVITSSSLLAQRDAAGIFEYLDTVSGCKDRFNVVSLCGEDAPVVRTFASEDNDDAVCVGIAEALRGIAAKKRAKGERATDRPTLYLTRKSVAGAKTPELDSQRFLAKLSVTSPDGKTAPVLVCIITRNLKVSDRMKKELTAALRSATVSITSWPNAPHFVDIRVGDMASFMFSELKSIESQSQSDDSGPKTATPRRSANTRRICIVDEVDYNLIDCKTRDFRLSTTVHDDLTVTVLDKFLREMREHFPKPQQVATPAPSTATTNSDTVAAPVVSSNLPVIAGKTAETHGLSTTTSSHAATTATLATTQATDTATGAVPPSTGRTPVGTVSRKNEVLAAALVHRYFPNRESLPDINVMTAAVERVGTSFTVADTLERDVDYVVDGLDLRIIDHSNHSFLPPNVVWNNLVHQIVQMKHNLPITMPPVYKDKMKVPELIKGYDLVIGLTATPGEEGEYAEYRGGNVEIYRAVKPKKNAKPKKKKKIGEPSSSTSMPNVVKEGVMIPNSPQQDAHTGPVLVIANEASEESVDNADRAATQVVTSPTSTLSSTKEESVRSSARTVADLLKDVAARFPSREHNKAVLVICKTPKTALEMYDEFERCNKQHNKFSVVTLFDRDSPDTTDTFRAFVALPGQVIIATSIAGRGVHIDPRVVDAPFTPPHGNAAQGGAGLDVIVTFMPENDRLKQQYKGRTHRLTRKGKFKIIDVDTASQHGRSSVEKTQLTYITAASEDVDFSAAIAASDVGGAASSSAAYTIKSSLEYAPDKPWYRVEYDPKPDKATVTLTNHINGFEEVFDKSQIYQSISLALMPLLDAIGPTILPADTDLAQAVSDSIFSSTKSPTGDSSAFMELLHVLYKRDHPVMRCDAHIFPTIIRYVYFSMDVNRTGFSSKTIEQWRRGWAGSIGCDEILRFRHFPVYINDSVLLWVKKFQSGNPSAFPYEYGDLPHVLFDAMRWTSKNLGYGAVTRYGIEHDLYHKPWAPSSQKQSTSIPADFDSLNRSLNEFLNVEFHNFRSEPMLPTECTSIDKVDPKTVFCKYRRVFSRCHALMCVPKQLQATGVQQHHHGNNPQSSTNVQSKSVPTVSPTQAMTHFARFTGDFQDTFVTGEKGRGEIDRDGAVLRQSYERRVRCAIAELENEKYIETKSALQLEYASLQTLCDEMSKFYNQYAKPGSVTFPVRSTTDVDDVKFAWNCHKFLREKLSCVDECSARVSEFREKIILGQNNAASLVKKMRTTKRNGDVYGYFVDGDCVITLFGEPHPTMQLRIVDGQLVSR